MTDRPYRPTSSLYTAQGRRKYLTSSERARFMDAARNCQRPELRTLCMVLAYTGCRISEALELTAGCIDIESGLIAIRSHKKRSLFVMREVPVPLELLDELHRTHGLDRLSGQERLWCWSRSRAWSLVKVLLAEAQVAQGPHATLKGLRHGFGIHAVQSGIPLNLVQRWLGHARMETTAIYLHAVGREERELAKRMWRSD